MPHSPHTGTGPSSGAPSSTSTSLLQRVKAREPEAWQRLVDLYAPLVYDWCRQSGLQAEDTADVGQEVFGAVAAKVGEFHHDRPGDSFRGWLWTITKNKIRDHFRHRRGQAQARGGTTLQQLLAQIPEEAPGSSHEASSVEGQSRPELRALELVRAEFEDQTWRVFWRTTVDRQPAAEVAEEFGMSVQAVYKAKSRVMQRIRRDLGELLD